MLNFNKYLKNKELFIALYFLSFILGLSIHISSNFYNESRVLETFLLLSLVFNKNLHLKKIEYIFIIFIIFHLFFLRNSQFIIFEILLYYLLYKAFLVINYNELLAKFIIWISFSIFSMLPIEIVKYIHNSIYSNWYPTPWNIRVYNSYFFVLSIFAIWFYLKQEKFKNIYLIFLFLAFLSILLDGGRSATLAYSVFIACVCIFNRAARFKLLFTYAATWLTYFSILFFSSHSASNVRSIVRESTSGRYELWVSAFQCWSQNPIFGCGFYQLDQYSGVISAHPHNLFIQVLTETGLIGFGFLILVIWNILKRIKWNLKENYFVISAFIAVSIDLSFSGIHIYPVTQVALLWLFVFLLKNPEFQHAASFHPSTYEASRVSQVFGYIAYISIALAFIYLFFYTSALSESLPSTPPRFWEYGYQLF
ncbi:O-antigen ligase family protein [Acinetobacter towneri]|uniref:O-antigen ligase family protein n=1 Tax=Acinetobacter towneri TaxID=202956 RepID=UPI00188B2EDA|nr:O-antigen ligase family protein [Acinetobacter towneri]MBF4521735.1 O-antigen ligase family protein [Acinetobacter towneri]